MTRTPNGEAKSASENEDAVKNSTNTNTRVRRTTAKAVKEGEVLPKAQPEDVSKPGDEQRPAEADNATPTGVERPENDPEKHQPSSPFSEGDDAEEVDQRTDSEREADEQAELSRQNSPLGLDPSEEGKADTLKDRNIEDLEQGAPTAAELPAYVPGPNETVPAGVVEVTRSAREGEASDPGGRVTERQKTGKQRAPKKDPLKDLDDLTKLPVAIAVGDVTGSVEEYAGRAVLSLSLRGWVGEAPLKILASEVGDLEQVIAELRSQLS